MNNSMRALTAFSLASALPASAALVSIGNLGSFGVNEGQNIVGDTATGSNNADNYTGLTFAGSNWGNELVFGFTLTETAVISGTLNSASGDPDTFLLNSLSTTPDPSDPLRNLADGGIGNPAFLDGPFGTTETYGVFPAGDYFVALGGFNTGFGDGFSVTAGGEAGDFIFNHAGGTESGSSNPDETVWFSFGVAVAEPGSSLLVALSGLALLRRRRR